MNRALYLYPITLSAIGVVIHFLGILRLFQLDVSIPIHVALFAIDLLVVIGLVRKTKWGYWLAVLLYVEQSIMQPILAYKAFMQGLGLFQLLVTSPLVIGALIILVFNKRLFYEQWK